MQITWKGNASVLLEAAGSRILFDPFVQLLGGEHPNTLEDFLDEEIIFITHGHFDHLVFVPEILDQSEATVFCTALPAATLETLTDNTDRIAQIKPGLEIPFQKTSGKLIIKAWQGQHVHFDRKLVASTIRPLHILRHIRNVPFLLWANLHFPEGGEILAYEISAEGKHILLLGSMGLKEDVAYPQNVDLLILPYQGTSRLTETALQIIERIRPRKIMLTHFDDAFPPMTKTVDTRPLRREMQQHYPERAVIKPTVDKPVRL